VEIVVELILELLLLAFNVTFGIGLAAVFYWLWVTVRRRLWGLDRPIGVNMPNGDLYSVEVLGLRLRTPLSTRIFRPGRALGGPPPEWSKADRLCPGRVAEYADDALIFVVPFLLVVVLLLVLLFLLEIILAVVALGLVAIVATIIRHRWTCLVTDPEGRVSRFRARGMRRVRRLRDETLEAIVAGNFASEGFNPAEF